MLALFKGELSYSEFMYNMTYKEMIALREARVNQLLEEKKQSEKDMQDQQSEDIRNRILAQWL